MQAFVACWLGRRFFPSPRWLNLVAADATYDNSLRTKAPGWHLDPDGHWLRNFLLRSIQPTRQTTFVLACVSQLALNRARRTFGGAFRSAAGLAFAEVLAGAAPTLLHPVVGKAHSIVSFDAWHLFVLVLLGALAAQAVVYPAVPQEEPEDE